MFVWGNGANGRLGLGHVRNISNPKLLDALATKKIVNIWCGASHSMALDENYMPYIWGKNSQGQCGNGTTEDVLDPIVPSVLEPLQVKMFAAGCCHSFFLIFT